MVTEKTSPRKRPVLRSDLFVNRVLGLGIIVIGAFIAYSLVFTSFQQRVMFQWEFENGERIPITHVTCPSPWSVLAEGAEPEAVVSGDLCVLPARGQVVQGAIVAVVALPLGLWVMTRKHRPRPLPELPESVRQLRRKESR